MANPHLPEGHTVLGAFHTVIVLTATEPIPHGVNLGTNLRCCPIGITAVGYYASEVLEAFVLM